jgi:glycosyltransferase involved in cell wall biosynthesis
MVHKGLDLVLEAFAQMPDFHLTVCGPVQHEKDFEDAYNKELYHTANILTTGWMDVSSPEFIEIARNCAGLVYPSCSEGQAGSVVTCMRAGLVPIVSLESGVDVSDDFGVSLRESSVNEIREAVTRLSSFPARQLNEMAVLAWKLAKKHSRDRFAEEYCKLVDRLIRLYHK